MTEAEFINAVTVAVLFVALALVIVGLYFSFRVFGGPVDPLEYPEDEEK